MAHEVDKDMDSYFLAGVYKFTRGEAGLLFRYNVFNATMVPVATAFKTKTWACARLHEGHLRAGLCRG